MRTEAQAPMGSAIALVGAVAAFVLAGLAPLAPPAWAARPVRPAAPAAPVLPAAPVAAAAPAVPAAPVTPVAPAAPAGSPAPVAPAGPTGLAGPTGPTGPAGGAPTGVVGPSGPPPGLDPATQSALATGGDPLAQNGLGSVVCSDPVLESQLTAQDRSDCQTSSFVAAAAPTDNYAFDIHIDTGLVPGNSTIALIVQELVLTPAWLACVWMVHALLVALEWCYTIDLLKGSTMTSVAAALRRAQATVTQPWLASVLAVGSLFALYHGIVRRRVAQTVGELLLTVAMMAGGLWVIFNPIGTVGALAAWANQASLGALAAASAISPARPVEAFVAGMRDLYSEGVYAPWCYLEFGDVQWCRDPAQLDPRLRAAAIAIAAANREGTDPAGPDSATLIERARTNGDLFLALPPNQGQRNSINNTSSLLRVMCQSSDADNCHGATAAQAEFRTAGGTWARAGGLLLIGLGMAGLIGLLAFVSLRLLAAAVASLIYLLLAPVAVLAPALGYSGRTAFRAWATRLLGAFTAKLLYSVLLGVVLLVMRILVGLSSVGWWAQWLLVCSLWWSVVHHRHRILRHATAGQIETSPKASQVLDTALRRRGRIVPAPLRRLPRIPRIPRFPAPEPRNTGEGGFKKGGGGSKSGGGGSKSGGGGSKSGGGGSGSRSKGGGDGASPSRDWRAHVQDLRTRVRRRLGAPDDNNTDSGQPAGPNEAVPSDAGDARQAPAGEGGWDWRTAPERLRGWTAAWRARVAPGGRARGETGVGAGGGAGAGPERAGDRAVGRGGGTPVESLAKRALAHERRTGAGTPRRNSAPDADRERLSRLRDEQDAAVLAGRPRRRASLARREGDLQARIDAAEEQRRAAGAASQTGEAGATAESRRVAQWITLLESQRRRPNAAAKLEPGDTRRDYTALAPIIGLDASAYGHLASGEQRRARLAIDRELNGRRRARSGAAGGGDAQQGPSGSAGATPGGARRAPAGAHRGSGARGRKGGAGGGAGGGGGASGESAVMRRERQFVAELAARGQAGVQPTRRGGPQGGSAGSPSASRPSPSPQPASRQPARRPPAGGEPRATRRNRRAPPGADDS